MIQGLDYNGITDGLWTLNFLQTERTIANGDSVNLSIGVPYWTAEIRVETPTRQSKAVWRSWLNARQASKVPLLISRAFSLVPRAGSVTDTGLGVSSVHKANSTVTLSGAGTWDAKPGDMLSYYTDAGGYWIGEITAAASASGGAITVSVVPTPATPHATLARPRRMYAFGEFVLSGRVQRQETADPDYLEFEARQIIRVTGGEASPYEPPASGSNFTIAETLTL